MVAHGQVQGPPRGGAQQHGRRPCSGQHVAPAAPGADPTLERPPTPTRPSSQHGQKQNT